MMTDGNHTCEHFAMHMIVESLVHLKLIIVYVSYSVV